MSAGISPQRLSNCIESNPYTNERSSPISIRDNSRSSQGTRPYTKTRVKTVQSDSLPKSQSQLPTGPVNGLTKGPNPQPLTTLDDIINSLESADMQEKYPEVPKDILSFISKLCKEHGIISPVWAQSPTVCREIIVLGRGVTAIEDQLVKEVTRLYPKFKVVTMESGPIHTKQFRGLTVQQFRADEDTTDWMQGPSGRCELILCGVDKTSCNPATNRREYLVIPAHVILSDTQCEWIADSTDGSAIHQTRRDVNAEVFDTGYILKLTSDQENDENFNLHERVMIGYRHYYKNVGHRTCDADYRCPGGKCQSDQLSSCPHMHMNDIAILSISCSEFDYLHSKIDGDERFHFASIALLTPEQIGRLIAESRIVYVGDLQCILRKCPTSVPDEEAEKTYADHVTFSVLPMERPRLAEGSSGSILYITHERTKLAFAMVTGEVRGYPGYYQAVLLKQALRDIELDYRHHVEDFQPFPFRPNDGPRPTNNH